MNGIIARRLGRRDLGGIFALALTARVVAVLVITPRLGADGVGFLNSAEALIHDGPAALGKLPLEHSPLYPVLIAPLVHLPAASLWVVALAQALIGAATAVLLARLTARETNSRTTGLCAGVIAAVHITFIFWTAYVLSETIFLFATALAADRLLLVVRGSPRPMIDGIAVGVLAILAIALRPTGAALALALFVTLVAVGRRPQLASALGFVTPFLLLGMAGFVSIAVLRLAQPAQAADHVREYAASAVVNGLLETESGRATVGHDLDINPPPIVNVLPAEQQSEFLEVGPLEFAARHPDFVITQSARKLRLFWTPVLPEYSAAHAVASLVYFSSLYALAVAGAVRTHRMSPLLVICGTSVAMFTLTSMVTIVDYDQRYRLPAELFLIPFAGLGLKFVAQFLRAYLHEDRLAVGSSPARGNVP